MYGPTMYYKTFELRVEEEKGVWGLTQLFHECNLSPVNSPMNPASFTTRAYISLFQRSPHIKKLNTDYD